MTDIFKHNKSTRKVLADIDRNGYVSVNQFSFEHWKRREMLNRMCVAGLIRPVIPIIGTYITYNRVDGPEKAAIMDSWKTNPISPLKNWLKLTAFAKRWLSKIISRT